MRDWAERDAAAPVSALTAGCGVRRWARALARSRMGSLSVQKQAGSIVGEKAE